MYYICSSLLDFILAELHLDHFIVSISSPLLQHYFVNSDGTGVFKYLSSATIAPQKMFLQFYSLVRQSEPHVSSKHALTHTPSCLRILYHTM